MAARAAAALLLSGALAVLGIGPLSGVTGVAAASAAPTMSLSTTTVVPGQTILVEGSGWAPGTTLQAVVCGSGNTAGSVDCANSSASTFAPFANGELQGVLMVEKPPSPCPCVVQVTGIANDKVYSLPITLVGVPVAPVPPPPVAGINTGITASATVTGGDTFASVMGAAAKRTLVVTLHNGGSDKVSTLLTARWGTGPSPGNVITSPPIVTIAPGATRTVSIPFALTALSHGTYRVVGQASGTVPVATFATTTTTWPWGLPLALAAVLALVILLVVLAARRPNRDEEEELLDHNGDPLTGLALLSAVVALNKDSNGPAEVVLSDVWLLADGDGAGIEGAAALASLQLDIRGIGLTEASTFRHGTILWESVESVAVGEWRPGTPASDDGEGPHGVPAGEPPVAGALLTVKTTATVFRVAVPNESPAALLSSVDRIVARSVPRSEPVGVGAPG